MFAPAPAPVPTLHQTDLFRPHADPDDHWDLACVYALAVEGRLDLKGILIDYPPSALPESAPDIEAVAQLSRLTGVVAPVAVGSSRPMRAPADRQDDAPASEQGGAAFVVRTLREATAPVVIHIVGSCRDIALAANREPALFRDKCAAIYLNAGTGWPDPDAVPEHEYNVQLNAAAYSAIFDVDCPIYWMPCFETVIGERVVREYATWYDFRQDEILPHLSPGLQRYFASMLSRATDTSWLQALTAADTRAIFAVRGPEFRNMWCTGGFLHSVGLSVTLDGEIVPLAEGGDRAAFTFEPISVTCDDSGRTRWRADPEARKRFIFRVANRTAYRGATTTALKTLVMTLTDSL